MGFTLIRTPDTCRRRQPFAVPASRAVDTISGRRRRLGTVTRCFDATSPPATDRPWPPRPKEVGARMRRYELMVLLDPDVEEKTVAPSLDQFLGVVRQDGGTVDKVDVWGRRRLAYEISKKTEAIYAVIDIVAEPASVKELDRQLNLNETVLRTKLMRPEKH